MTLRSVTVLAAFSLSLAALTPYTVGVRHEDDAGGLESQEREFRWTGRIEPGDVLEIKGVNGAVVASRATGDQAEVVAEKRWRRGDPEDVIIEVVEHERGVTICAVYPGRSWKDDNFCAPGDDGKLSSHENDVRVTFEVSVPEGVHFVGKTVNGDVDAEDLTADVSAYTVNGDVSVSTAGRAWASTVNGSIRAEMGRADWGEDVEFTTVNGSITLYLPERLSAEVSAQTLNGHIDTDFPLTIRRRSRWGPRRISGTIGDGGPELYLKTVNGSIRLRELRS